MQRLKPRNPKPTLLVKYVLTLDAKTLRVFLFSLGLREKKVNLSLNSNMASYFPMNLKRSPRWLNSFKKVLFQKIPSPSPWMFFLACTPPPPLRNIQYSFIFFFLKLWGLETPHSLRISKTIGGARAGMDIFWNHTMPAF